MGTNLEKALRDALEGEVQILERRLLSVQVARQDAEEAALSLLMWELEIERRLHELRGVLATSDSSLSETRPGCGRAGKR